MVIAGLGYLPLAEP